MFLLLFGGYASLYFCRADLAVATPLLIGALKLRGLKYDDALIRIGEISSLGVLAYGFGKFFLAGLGDAWGGRYSFLTGLLGATACTLVFASGLNLPLFGLAWIGNQLTQSVSWAGLLKVSSKWFDYSSHGLVIALLSLSYLIGDAAARQWMGVLIERGFEWQALFYLAAGAAGAFLLLNFLFLRESRADCGFSAAKPNPLNLFSSSEERAPSLRERLLPLLRSHAFLLVCLLSLGCTIIREAFNLWIPVYLSSHVGYTLSNAARLSAVFPAVGAISVLAAGGLSDRLGIDGRPLILFGGLTATTAALLVLASIPASSAAPLLPLLTIGSIAFFLLGPYSFLGGAIALDFGGKTACATLSGIIDGIGYLGAAAAGSGIAQLSVRYGWQGVYLTLSAVSALAAATAGRLYFQSKKAASNGDVRP